MLADFYVDRVAGWFGPTVYGVMLGCRNDAIVLRVVTLHACDECDAQARRQEGILSKGFLPASPARITKDVDVRSPEIEALKDIAVPVAQTLDVLDSPFGADHDGHAVDCVRVKGRGQRRRIGKLGRAIRGNAVGCLAPPVVVRQIQARDGARLVHELRYLLFHRHTVDEILSPLLWGQGSVQISRRLGVLC